MSVDDMTIVALHLKRIEDTVAHFFRIAQFEVVAFFFLVGLLVLEEIAFKSSHFRFVKEGRIFATPKVEEVVACIVARIFFLLVAGNTVCEGRTNHHSDVVHEVLTAIGGTRVDFHLFE